MSIHQLVGKFSVDANAEVLLLTCGTNETRIGQRDTYRQVFNARSRGIIVGYCVFNSMQYKMDL